VSERGCVFDVRPWEFFSGSAAAAAVRGWSGAAGVHLLPITCSRPGAWCQSEQRAGESITYTLSWSAENSGEARGWWGLAGLQTTLATFVIHPPPKLSRIPPAPFAPRERSLSLSLSLSL
jgi:hypothetical protein